MGDDLYILLLLRDASFRPYNSRERLAICRVCSCIERIILDGFIGKVVMASVCCEFPARRVLPSVSLRDACAFTLWQGLELKSLILPLGGRHRVVGSPITAECDERRLEPGKPTRNPSSSEKRRRGAPETTEMQGTSAT
ncbi:hypothetical protein TNCT_325501 [Trichonephila clavata]|uniref:Uncharacterized protein n=1 Tax=Trichonephila clavata TaxID=2740835 RepID=A0A8X6FFL9_TRICU|nr:hypothetical protein TNCT_325501 [Trichonephila clavata]